MHREKCCSDLEILNSSSRFSDFPSNLASPTLDESRAGAEQHTDPHEHTLHVHRAEDLEHAAHHHANEDRAAHVPDLRVAQDALAPVGETSGSTDIRDLLHVF